MLQNNLQAPDFSLYATPDQLISLSSLKGSNVILVFYPADWSPVCSDQLTILNEAMPYFKKYNTLLSGISTDGRWCHLAFSKDRHLHFPLLADFEPKGAVARLYEVYDPGKGECLRASYIIDKDGIIRWSYLSPTGINPGADGLLNALEEMNIKEIKDTV